MINAKQGEVPPYLGVIANVYDNISIYPPHEKRRLLSVWAEKKCGYTLVPLITASTLGNEPLPAYFIDLVIRPLFDRLAEEMERFSLRKE